MGRLIVSFHIIFVEIQLLISSEHALVDRIGISIQLIITDADSENVWQFLSVTFIIDLLADFI